MIINPVKFPVWMHPNNGGNNVSQRNFVTLPSQNDRFALSFSGVFESSQVPINLEQAMRYSGIHCPCCGIQMLSQEDFDYILAKSRNVKNAGEFVNILRENKKYIPHRFEHIFDDIEKIPDYENMPVSQFRKELGSIAYLRKKQIIHDTKDYLIEYAQKFAPEKSQKAIATISELTIKQNYIAQKETLTRFTKDLELNSNQTDQIFAKVLKPLLYANGYTMLFFSKKFLEMPETEYGRFISSRIFYPSLSTVNTILGYPLYENLPNNKVLLCKNCESNRSKNVFWKTGNYPLLKENMKSYLTDLAYLMGDEKMDISYDYHRAFTEIVTKITKNEIKFTTGEIKALKNVRRAANRHEHFLPIEQTEVDIPCAECGSIILPHSKRKEIEEELKNCSTPYEYSQVLWKNLKYVGVNYQVLARIFLEIVKNNPNISNEEFLREFLKKEAHYSEKAVQKTLNTFWGNRIYVAENNPPQCLEIYDTFSKRLFDYIDSGKFNDYDDAKLFKTCIKGLDTKNYPVKPIFILVRNLKNISYRHMCTSQEANKNFNDKDRIYTILFHLFKYNVATADHLQPDIKGGEGDKYNLIGLCKSCNRTKSQKNVHNWYIENKNLAPNLRKQLKVIDDMAKTGQIEGYDDWAKTIAQKIYEQTYGKLDLREDFI